MTVIGLIPARGGSKGIPRKNLAQVAGKPLLAWTVDAARASTTLDRVIVSTDDDEIAAVARDLGAEVPFLRPEELAADATPMVDVVLDALDRIGDCEALCLLQPTSPLRRAEHVDGAVELLRRSGAESVVSVVGVPHRYAPESLMRLEDGVLVPLAEDGPLRRQDKTHVYARNGPAVLVVRPGVVRTERRLYVRCRPYPMDAAESLDVDSPFELELAGILLGRRAGT